MGAITIKNIMPVMGMWNNEPGAVVLLWSKGCVIASIDVVRECLFLRV
ncbi:hypothetical protein GGD61_004577 [Bradyrhizobium sp. SBR1B]|nr:hypothetical protein [Bradyrhizobium sp. SBR1B]